MGDGFSGLDCCCCKGGFHGLVPDNGACGGLPSLTRDIRYLDVFHWV